MALPTICDDDAKAAIRELARSHPHLAHHIRTLGCVFLRRSCGLRDGRADSRTYDLSFVNGRGSFATLTATPRKHDAATENRLQVQVRFQGDRKLGVFRPKSRGAEQASGWHATQLAGNDSVVPLLVDLLDVFAG